MRDDETTAIPGSPAARDGENPQLPRSRNRRLGRRRLLPYRTIDDKIDGVVLNFVDITVRRQAEELRRRTALLEEQTRILGLAKRTHLWP
jgi:PAS domain-containing protein